MFRLPPIFPFEYARMAKRPKGKGFTNHHVFIHTMGAKPVMNPDEYQVRAAALAIYPEERAIEYVALGLASEAGEVAGKVKKSIRDGKDWTGEQREEMRQKIKAELGDVIWYVSETARQYGFSLTEIMHANISKLEGRKARNTLGGSGDER